MTGGFRSGRFCPRGILSGGILSVSRAIVVGLALHSPRLFVSFFLSSVLASYHEFNATSIYMDAGVINTSISTSI